MSHKIDYPKSAIRGIKNSTYLINNNGGITVSAALFSEFDKEANGWKELSINWQDDDEVLNFTLNQRHEDGELVFKVGAVTIKKDVLDGIIAYYKAKSIIDVFKYERKQLENNKYHGNLLLKSNIDKGLRTQIANTLAMYTSPVILQEKTI